jgi:hypothetical protein
MSLQKIVLVLIITLVYNISDIGKYLTNLYTVEIHVYIFSYGP